MLSKLSIRIATLGDWGRYFSYFLAGTQEGAILNGCLFRPIDIRQSKEHILKCLAEFRPHILFCHCIFGKIFRPQEQFELLSIIRRKYGTKVYYHLGDARTEPRYPHDISNFVDASLVNQTENLQKFSNIWGVPTYHWPYGCFSQKDIVEPINEFKHDLVFTGRLGGGVHEGRTKFIKDLKSIFPSLIIYPNKGYPDTKLLTPEISSSSKAILGVCAGYNIGGYMDVRPYQYPGAGGVLFQRYYKGMDKVFKNKEHLIWFTDDSPKEFLKLYNECINNKGLMEKVRVEGFKFCQKYHSYKRRVKDIIDITFGLFNNTKILMKDLEENDE